MPKVRVRGWKERCDEDAMLMISKVFGEVVQVIDYGKIGVVEFRTLDSAKEAVRVIQGVELVDGSVLTAELYYRLNSRVCAEKIVSKNEVVGILGKYGRIYNVDEDDRYYYVDYYDMRDAECALRSVIHIDDRVVLRTRRPVGKHVSSSQTVFVYNLPNNTSVGELIAVFGKFGEIVTCGVEDGRGYVNYVEGTAAKRVLKQMGKLRIKGRRIRVKLKGT